MKVTRFKTESIVLYFGGHHFLFRYGLALLIVAIAAIATLYIPVIGERAAFLLFLFAVIQTNLWLGWDSGFLATILSLIAVNVLILFPARILQPHDIIILNAGFCVLSAAIIATAGFHRKLMTALRENRQCYARIVESAMDAMITIDDDYQILLFNAAAEKMFGCKAGDAIGGSIKRFIPVHLGSLHNSDIPIFNSISAINPKIGQLNLITGQRTNGEEFLIEASISQFIIDGEKSFTAILREVTDERGDIAIHERLRLQDQLVKVAASVPGLICSFRLRPDGSTCMPYASPVIKSLYGLSLDVVAEDFSPVFARIHPDDIGHINDTIAESASTFKPWRDTYRYNHPTKGEVWHEGYSMPLREMDGSILWHGYIQDVTERKQTEAELQERIVRYELILDGAQDAIWDWDVLNKRVDYSSRWKALHGFAEDEVGNDEEAWSTNIHPDDSVRVLAAVQSHFEGKTQVFCEEYRTHCKDGSWKWIVDRGICQRDMSGQVVRMAGSENDITDRKLAETALLERETELRLIMDATPALISYLNTDFRYLRVNATYENWFGLTAEHILGYKVWEIVGKKAWNIISPYLKRVLAGERVNFDQLIPYGNAKPRWVQATYIPHKDSTGIVNGIVTHVFDIDERKRMEEALRKSQKENKFFADLIRNSSQPVGVGYPDGRLGLINLAFENLTGYTAEELQRIDWATELTPPEWCEIEGDKLAELQRTGNSVRYEKEYIRKNGTRVPIELLVQLVSDPQGKPQYFYAFITDLTERKQAENALRESEERMRLTTEKHLHELRTYQIELEMQNEELRQAALALQTSHRHYIELYDFAPVGYMTLTTEGMITEINLTGAKLLGVERNKLIHWRFAKFIADNYKDDWYRFSLLAKQQDGKQSIVLPLHCEGGTDLFVHFDCQYKHADDETPLLHIVLIDVTERSLAEAALRESEARLALIIEEAKAGYWDWNLNTRALYLSPEWKRQIGFDENELPSRWEEWESRLHPDDQGLVLAATENYIAGRQPVYELEYRLRHKDGSYRWIHSRGGLLRDQNNQPIRMLGINLDITDYKKTRELSERREQMEQLFRASLASQTAAAIAHELNQPLAAISSYADVALYMLQTGYQEPQKLAHVLENCALQAQRAGDVIRQLLTVLHKGEALSEPIDINISVRDAIAFVKTDNQFGAFKIELDLDDDLGRVMANGLQIQKVLINLLRNGLESLRESGINAGTITVTTRCSTDDPTLVQVTVCDSGKGVADSATLRTMFQPFYTTKASGLGMGLAISRTLIEAHGGKMWAEQNADIGISVHFTLPFVI